MKNQIISVPIEFLKAQKARVLVVNLINRLGQTIPYLSRLIGVHLTVRPEGLDHKLLLSTS